MEVREGFSERMVTDGPRGNRRYVEEGAGGDGWGNLLRAGPTRADALVLQAPRSCRN